MEVVYCAGCGRRIDAQETARGEVAKVLQDYYCLKCAQAMGLSLQPTEERRAPAARPPPSRKSARGTRPTKARNTTLVLLALAAAFLVAGLCGVYMVRSRRGTTSPAARRARRVRRGQGQPISPPGRTGTEEPRALFAPRTRFPGQDEPKFRAQPTPPPPAPAQEERKERTIEDGTKAP